MMKSIVLLTMMLVMVNVTGGEKPAMSILFGNNITINVGAK
ncbi:hypothetical protein PSR30_04455 [Pectobacterium carotovorum subsp. carotovorum]|nr:hypothetical protein [Pectobacterium carotovorum]WDF99827.1 hypothetical protein PSR30_04455 [Pectobacterium carotovorum subsp. carotovorum]